MERIFKYTVIALTCSSALLLSACGDDDNDIFVDTKTQTFNVSSDVQALVNVHDILTYEMLSVTKKNIKATTLVFTPKGNVPVGGWPVVVWAHGTTGAADQCAPSRNPLVEEEKALIMALVKKGYAVIAPDYEGLGNDQVAHPYLHLESAARSILSALSEANKQYSSLSKNWSVIGWSQGGHAALAAAEYNKALEGYNFKGTVAIAPASYLAETLELGMTVANGYAQANDLASAIPVAATLYTYAAIVSSGIKAEKNSFNYSQAFVPTKTELASKAETLCSPELGQAFGSDIQTTLTTNGGVFSAYKALQDNFVNDPDIKSYLSSNIPAQTKLDKKVYIYQGTADTTVPYPITEALVANMKLQGTDTELVLKPNETHSTAVGNNIDELVGKLDTLMKQ